MSRALMLSCLLVAVLVGACVCGCRESLPPGTVVLLVRANASQAEAWQKAIDAYTEASKVSVVLRAEPPEKYNARLQSAVSGSDPADVVLVDSTEMPRLLQGNSFLSLDSYLQSQQDLKPSDFNLQALRPYRYQGSLYGLPTDMHLLAVAYNLDQFELARLTPPKPTWTWQDYLQYAKTLTRDNDSGGTTWGTLTCPYWETYVWQNGGELVDNVENPRRSTLNTPAAVGALQFLADLSLKEKVAPPVERVPAGAAVKAFCANEIGMIYVTSGDVAEINKATDLRWGLLTAPRNKQAATLASGVGLCIPKSCRRAEAAWKLLSYLAGNDGQKQLLTASFTSPPLEYLANSEYFAGVDASGRNPFAAVLKSARQLPLTPQYDALRGIYDGELQALWSGKATAQDVCARIDERVNAALAANAGR